MRDQILLEPTLILTMANRRCRHSAAATDRLKDSLQPCSGRYTCAGGMTRHAD